MDTEPTHDWLTPPETDPQRQTAAEATGPGFLLWGIVGLGLALAAIRVWVLRAALGEVAPGRWPGLLAQGLWQDLALVLGLGFVAVALHRAAGGARARAWVRRGFGVLAVGILWWGLANVVALRMLGSPVTLEWLAYSDIDSTDVIFDSLRRLFGWRQALVAAGSALALTGGAWLAARWLRHGGPGVVLLGLFAVLAIFGLARRDLPGGPEAARCANPVLAFAASLWSEGGRGGLDALAAAPIAGAEMPFAPAVQLALPPAPAKPLRNVILFAFDSTPARQAQGWGGQYPVTPNLQAALAQGLAFDHAYAHVPASNYYLVSVFGGLIPELSSLLMTSGHPALDLHTLPEVLGAAGLRSGFFNSSDNRFQNAEGFLKGAGFDFVGDYRDWACDTGVYEFESVTDKFLNTSSDLCSVDAITRWIGAAPEAPFFVAFRTGMTHYPYFPGTAPERFVEDDTYNDYLNALRVGDAAFGRLMGWLAAEGLAEETLVVVLGDHGEAFGEHGTLAHASAIFEENVNIPMALINPQLFSGQRSDLIVGISDIAATVTDLLGLMPSPSWQGRSVFAPGRRDGTLFFAPWNGFQIGFREGMQKFIFNGNSGAALLFDLAADPGEQTDLAAVDPEALAAARRRLGQAIAAQNAYTDQLIAGGAPAASPAPPEAPPAEIVIEASGTRFQNAPRAWITLDGAHVAVIEVTSAPSNADAPATAAQIDAGVARFVLPVAPGECPREIGVWFLNDEWAGEGLSGDTDLMIRSVDFAGERYMFNRLVPEGPGIGGQAGDYFRFWRSGAAHIDLVLDRACLSTELARP